MIAALPMYDWPETRAATDAFWAAVRDALTDLGVEAHETLDRSRDAASIWRDPGLLLAQTCGLPFVAGAAQGLRLLASPIYTVAGCEGPTYRSALVAWRGENPEPSNTRFALNGFDSLSGWLAPLAHLDTTAPSHPFTELVETGSHRASVKAVATGEADLAAIDAVAWRLALSFEPAAEALEVVGWTPPFPSLPFVTAPNSPISPEYAQRALTNVIASHPEVAQVLHLTGVAPPQDYHAVLRPHLHRLTLGSHNT